MGGVLDRHATVRSTLADSSLRSWSVDVLRAVFEQVRAARSTNARTPRVSLVSCLLCPRIACGGVYTTVVSWRMLY